MLTSGLSHVFPMWFKQMNAWCIVTVGSSCFGSNTAVPIPLPLDLASPDLKRSCGGWSWGFGPGETFGRWWRPRCRGCFGLRRFPLLGGDGEVQTHPPPSPSRVKTLSPCDWATAVLWRRSLPGAITLGSWGGERGALRGWFLLSVRCL
jgi:hypothetical protein